MQQQAQINPQLQQQAQMEAQQLSVKIEARKAVLIAEMTEEFMKEEKTITSQFDHDPLLKLKSREVDLKAMENQRKEEEKITGEFAGDPLLKIKSREVDLRAMENERKEEEGEERLNLDKMKALMNDQQHDEKLEQNEELAHLRAGVSIAKQQMADQSKRHDFGRNFKKK